VFGALFLPVGKSRVMSRWPGIGARFPSRPSAGHQCSGHTARRRLQALQPIMNPVERSRMRLKLRLALRSIGVIVVLERLSDCRRLWRWSPRRASAPARRQRAPRTRSTCSPPWPTPGCAPAPRRAEWARRDELVAAPPNLWHWPTGNRRYLPARRCTPSSVANGKTLLVRSASLT